MIKAGLINKVSLISLVALLCLPGLVSANSPAKLDYMINCQGCHLHDGSGMVGSVPSFKNYVGKFLSVKGGREFLVQVPGSANSSLSDRELAELLNWILKTMSPEQIGNNFKPYSEKEVQGLRKQLLVEVDTTRADLVKGFN